MLTVDIKSLLRRLNSYCTSGLEGAAGLCVSRTHYEVTVEHLLVKLLENPQADLALILRHFELDPGRVEKALAQSLEEFKTGNAAKPVFSPLLLEWIQEAWLVASVDLTEARVRSGAMLSALLSRPRQLAGGKYVELLTAISRDALMKGFWDMVKGSTEQAVKETSAEAEAGPPGEATALKRFCTDFTAKAAAGDIDPVFGRDREIRQMVDILARRRKNNPIVVGEAGVGKTAVVEGLALRIVEGDVPELLRDVSILGLDMGLLQAGAGMKGEFENRLKSVIGEIKASVKPIILFIDEAHTLIGAGGSAGMSDAANLLKPALARGELRTVAATTWSEYKKYFEKDPALARRFQLVKLDEPSAETAKLILRGLKAKYEEAHHVVVRDDAIEAAAEMSSRYISGRQLPDKAVDLLDTSAARVKILLTAKPDVVEDKERRIQALARELEGIGRDRHHGVSVDAEREKLLTEEREQLLKALEEIKLRWRSEQELAHKVIELRRQLAETAQAGQDTATIKAEVEDCARQLAGVQGDAPMVRTEVDPDVVAKVVSDWTGIPLGKVMRDQARSILQLEARLKERIKGQDEGMIAIAQVLKAAKSGIKDPNQPLGVFLLAGPSGVGKTETGLAIADLLFGGENFIVTINMSEFQEKHTVSRLIGSPPGYVGYGEGGVLSEAVRQRPYSVVLLDEVEKGHPEVLNLFYQVFDKGMLADGEGREIDFKNTVLFLTSNLATDVITAMCTAEEVPPLETIAGAVRPILSSHFKPALLARMNVIPYKILAPEVLKQIVVLKMEKLVRRLNTTHKIAMTYSPAVVDQIAARCTEVETGARNIDYIMSGTIMPRMSQEILSHMSTGQMPASVHLDLDTGGGFSVAFGG
ncbi:MAG: type VI secretion system ATPase TssH [Desulfatitalea sp.]